MIEKLKRFPGDEPKAVETPQCQAEVQYTDHQRKWRIEHGESMPFLCVRPSVVRIGEEHFCRLHGGHRVLDMYLRGELK